MSSIVLSAAVRQNLLSLQTTALQLAQTQNNLSTGNKVNSALDNPTNFFTASGLNNRASDISNLLDGISNGVQVIQAANTGITSVQSLVSQAKSIANQALQTSIGYSSKSSVTSAAITDSSGNAVTASNLLGAGTVSAGATTGTAVNATTSSTPLTASTTLASLGIVSTDAIGINGDAVFFDGTGGATTGTHLDLSVATVGDLLTEVTTHGHDSMTYSISAGQITLTDTAGGPATFDITDPAGVAAKLGLTATGGTVTQTGSAVTLPGATAAITGSTVLSTLSSAPANNSTITVNGKTLTFSTSASTSVSANGGTINLSSGTVNDVLNAINTISGGTSSINATTGAITLNSSLSSSLVLGGTALGSFSLSAGTYPPVGNTLTIAAVGNGTATSITFGDGTNGTVKTLDQLNAALSANNLQATLSTSGQLTVTTTNDNASATIGTIGGTVFSSASGAFHGKAASAPVADATSQATRASLVNQYNALLTQIDNTAADSSYNGINLLNGDQLQLTFNETGKSKLSITGVNDTSAGLGLAQLSSTAFKDNAATNAILTSLNTVSTTLRSQASAFGSNLSVVQTRQDFNKNLINVLQTGSANLTQADINLEAANSQALSTRQSLSVSALSLANQSQQSVLQLLR